MAEVKLSVSKAEFKAMKKMLQELIDSGEWGPEYTNAEYRVPCTINDTMLKARVVIKMMDGIEKYDAYNHDYIGTKISKIADCEEMYKTIIGISINYQEFANATDTHGLDKFTFCPEGCVQIALDIFKTVRNISKKLKSCKEGTKAFRKIQSQIALKLDAEYAQREAEKVYYEELTSPEALEIATQAEINLAIANNTISSALADVIANEDKKFTVSWRNIETGKILGMKNFSYESALEKVKEMEAMTDYCDSVTMEEQVPEVKIVEVEIEDDGSNDDADDDEEIVATVENAAEDDDDDELIDEPEIDQTQKMKKTLAARQGVNGVTRYFLNGIAISAANAVKLIIDYCNADANYELSADVKIFESKAAKDLRTNTAKTLSKIEWISENYAPVSNKPNSQKFVFFGRRFMKLTDGANGIEIGLDEIKNAEYDAEFEMDHLVSTAARAGVDNDEQKKQEALEQLAKLADKYRSMFKALLASEKEWAVDFEVAARFYGREALIPELEKIAAKFEEPVAEDDGSNDDPDEDEVTTVETEIETDDEDDELIDEPEVIEVEEKPELYTATTYIIGNGGAMRPYEKKFKTSVAAYNYLLKKRLKYAGITRWTHEITYKGKVIYENGSDLRDGEVTTDSDIQKILDAEQAKMNHILAIGEFNNYIAYWSCECAVTPEAMEIAVQTEIDNAATAMFTEVFDEVEYWENEYKNAKDKVDHFNSPDRMHGDNEDELRAYWEKEMVCRKDKKDKALSELAKLKATYPQVFLKVLADVQNEYSKDFAEGYGAELLKFAEVEIEDDGSNDDPDEDEVTTVETETEDDELIDEPEIVKVEEKPLKWSKSKIKAAKNILKELLKRGYFGTTDYSYRDEYYHVCHVIKMIELMQEYEGFNKEQLQISGARLNCPKSWLHGLAVTYGKFVSYSDTYGLDAFTYTAEGLWKIICDILSEVGNIAYKLPSCNPQYAGTSTFKINQALLAEEFDAEYEAKLEMRRAEFEAQKNKNTVVEIDNAVGANNKKPVEISGYAELPFDTPVEKTEKLLKDIKVLRLSATAETLIYDNFDDLIDSPTKYINIDFKGVGTQDTVTTLEKLFEANGIPPYLGYDIETSEIQPAEIGNAAKVETAPDFPIMADQFAALELAEAYYPNLHISGKITKSNGTLTAINADGVQVEIFDDYLKIEHDGTETTIQFDISEKVFVEALSEVTAKMLETGEVINTFEIVGKSGLIYTYTESTLRPIRTETQAEYDARVNAAPKVAKVANCAETVKFWKILRHKQQSLKAIINEHSVAAQLKYKVQVAEILKIVNEIKKSTCAAAA